MGQHGALDLQDAHKASERTERIRTDEECLASGFPVDGTAANLQIRWTGSMVGHERPDAVCTKTLLLLAGVYQAERQASATLPGRIRKKARVSVNDALTEPVNEEPQR